jgi:hypothetical protein
MFETLFILSIFIVAFICLDRIFNRRSISQTLTFSVPHSFKPGSILTIQSAARDAQPIELLAVTRIRSATTVEVAPVDMQPWRVETWDVTKQAEYIKNHGQLDETDKF